MNKRVAKVLRDSRYVSGKSQEYMALELNVSKTTVINWEKGLSSPKAEQFLAWFNAIGINAHRPLMELIYPEVYENIKPKDSDERILKAIENFIETSSITLQREICYIVLGNHGSSPTAILQLFAMYLHLPMKYRICTARMISEMYELANKQGELVCKENIMPDVTIVENAIKEAKSSMGSGYQVGKEKSPC